MLNTSARCSPITSRLFTRRFLVAITQPILRFGDRHPGVRRVLGHVIPWIPYPALHDTKRIIDTLDDTSRDIYRQKKLALMGGDEGLKIGVEEGRDLMSVLRASSPTKFPLNMLLT